MNATLAKLNRQTTNPGAAPACPLLHTFLAGDQTAAPPRADKPPLSFGRDSGSR